MHVQVCCPAQSTQVTSVGWFTALPRTVPGPAAWDGTENDSTCRSWRSSLSLRMGGLLSGAGGRGRDAGCTMRRQGEADQVFRAATEDEEVGAAGARENDAGRRNVT